MAATNGPPSPRAVDPRAVDAVVVGSGFGGAVTAARLAQAGFDVVVLERGRRWQPAEFPRGDDLKRDWLWQGDRGLFDVRWLDRMVSVQGAGWGGGSLVYANVFARPPAEVFDDRWPASYSRDALEPYYDLTAHMLEVSPVAPDPRTGSVPARTRLLESATRDLRWPTATVRPQLAVRFGDPGARVLNRHGAEQAGCSFVGECVIGCPQRAKNTLDYNYLFAAERAGAQARVDTEVRAVRPVGVGYVVEAFDHRAEETLSWTAPAVFLAAGAVGTTELLLRMRASGELPGLSDRLGESFSGNGDYLSFVRRHRSAEDLGRGPTITSTTILTARSRGERFWFQLQDGDYPSVFTAIAAAANPVPALTPALTALARVGRRVLPRLQSRSTVMTLLLMGRDSANGRLVLDHHHDASVTWDNRGNAHLYRAEGAVARAVGKRLGARVLPLPTWSLLRRAVTVHNLGGAGVGTGPETGVVDEHGEVFGHPGLFVVDGAALPGATGANPSATIAAVAERRVEHFIRATTGEESWVAPETADVVPADVPEDRAAEELRPAPERPIIDAVRFAETLSGSSRDGGAGSESRTVLDLRARAELGLGALSRDPLHGLELSGAVSIEGVATEAAVTGSLSLFPEHSADAMRYDLDFTDDAGVPRHLTGTKRQHPGHPLALWRDMTVLRIRVSGPKVLTGTVSMSLPAVLRLTGSIRGEAERPALRARAVAVFLIHFGQGALRGLLGPRPR